MLSFPLLVFACTSQNNHLARQFADAAASEDGAQWPVDHRMLDQRTILLTSHINAASAHRIIAELLTLARRDPRKPINFYIVSPGGDLGAALAVVAVMRMIDPPVNTHALASCESGAALLLIAGTGQRTASPGSVIGIHGYITHGQVPPRYLRLLVKRYAYILRTRTNLPGNWFPIEQNEIHVLSAAEALRYHVVDAVTRELPTRAMVDLGRPLDKTSNATARAPAARRSITAPRPPGRTRTAGADRIADK